MKITNASRWRWAVVVLFMAALSGGYMMLYALSPLQSLLETEAGWTLISYSRYSSAESFLNVFCGILLIAGLLTDRIGVPRCGLLSGGMMLLGGVLNYFALTETFAGSEISRWFETNLNLPAVWWNITPLCSGMPASAKLSAIGFMLFGVGIEMAGIATSRGTVRWFRGKEFATAMGVQLAGSRLMVALALWASPRVATFGTTDVGRPLLWILWLLIVGVVCWILYAVQEKREIRYDKREKSESFFAPLKLIVKNNNQNRRLWLLCAICVLYYASVIPFYRYATIIFQTTLGIQAASAASLIAALPLISALATPFMGMVVDLRGGGLRLMCSGCVCIILSYCILGLWLPLSPKLWIAYAAIGLLGLSSAMISSGLWPLLPRLAPEKALGSSYAMFYWMQALGLYLTPLAVAYAVNDAESAGRAAYAPALWLFAVLATIALMGALQLAVVNNKQKLGLNSPNKQRT